jgi:hypothetical protein
MAFHHGALGRIAGMDNWHEWLELRNTLESEFREMLRPELEEKVVGGPYVVLTAELNLPFDPKLIACGGFTSTDLSSAFRGSIEERGKWTGHGPTYVLVCEQLDGESFSAIRREIVSNAVHEFSHTHFDNLYIYHESPGKPQVSVSERFDGVRSDKVTDSVEVDISQLPYHGWKFIRLLLHVAYRAENRGLPLSVVDAMDWDFYAPEGPFAYRNALWTELQQLADKPLSEIAQMPIPDSMKRLWSMDQGFRKMLRLGLRGIAKRQNQKHSNTSLELEPVAMLAAASSEK